jgi:hypothetical protein
MAQVREELCLAASRLDELGPHRLEADRQVADLRRALEREGSEWTVRGVGQVAGRRG